MCGGLDQGSFLLLREKLPMGSMFGKGGFVLVCGVGGLGLLNLLVKKNLVGLDGSTLSQDLKANGFVLPESMMKSGTLLLAKGKPVRCTVDRRV